MKKIDIKKQMFTMMLLIIAISFVIAFSVILPTIQSIRGLQKDINDTRLFLEEQSEKIQKMRRSIHSLGDIEKQIEKFRETSTVGNHELEIITKLEQIANEHNINQSLKAILYEAKTGSSAGDNLPPLLKDKNYYVFSFSSEGKYEDIIKYLRAIEQLPYYFSINSIQLSRKNDIGTISLRFDATLFIFDK
ncbi:MAG: hypothetical protein A2469_04680 [Candidatus Magasanikbacteria bacterium RIFOXYC2_FULL_40_16]|uniref:Type 4a pilus biogenesis protein PilO n=3 Tax=Candidatus Magasanikiibacteriota TaxID=1752731 RepID=A0A1F6NID1_9BACT|nr:MAG: hypothetical protein A2224_02275 [Candidatus Magasanikbacteria bacterium RIFOXYA2_FULL_40_20]OGH83806.1 MAG: hypothetical protein A2373_03575 [Candidatus Magasanikbacteria bacterium RIFOXYB1_FULL_40_15]OGH86805.1 MAG: hypothetical protein A2301_00850 [Candidatus Magasanikbacteria bacterium RIFOXYB2_FULL_40_13]OGH87389.1 MAG: hypothetical protein A2206_00100 [Candidatus Magasanikbacteria bacterium RIFOXYA1_FULL_40_8]OGH89331.1 MAG: hypothetical protein A2469_04680 [Candidatus Magasanikba